VWRLVPKPDVYLAFEVFQFLQFEGRISANSTVHIKSPQKGRKLPDTLSYDEITAILEAAEFKYQ
jgi:site-specific recombinase XerD